MSISVNANQGLLGSFESQYKNKESLQTKDTAPSTTKVSDNLALSLAVTKSATKQESSIAENNFISAASIADAESAAARLNQTAKYIFSNSAIALSAQANISHQTALDLLTSN